MTDSLNNKELVAVGHEFARTMSSDTPIIDMAKIVSRLAERLDCTTAALREMTKQRDAAEQAERVWETTMMEVCGEDGPASVAAEIAALRAKRDTALESLRQKLAEVVPDGWKLVPIIALPSQWAAGQKAFNSAGMNKVDAVYKAMIEAAPLQEVK